MSEMESMRAAAGPAEVAMHKPRCQDQRATARDPGFPAASGLYDPRHEKDSCGVGFVADIKNRKSHTIVAHGLKILENLEHRGAVGADPKAGDGCGMLVQIPHRFLKEECAKLGFNLPEPGHYAVGQYFLPRDAEARAQVEKIIEQTILAEGQSVLGWRDVPVDNSDLGETVKPTEPCHRQVFIGRAADIADEEAFERRLFILRKVISHTLYLKQDRAKASYYPVSVSCRTLTYKGMLLSNQLGAYFKDLRCV